MADEESNNKEDRDALIRLLKPSDAEDVETKTASDLAAAGNEQAGHLVEHGYSEVEVSKNGLSRLRRIENDPDFVADKLSDEEVAELRDALEHQEELSDTSSSEWADSVSDDKLVPASDSNSASMNEVRQVSAALRADGETPNQRLEEAARRLSEARHQMDRIIEEEGIDFPELEEEKMNVHPLHSNEEIAWALRKLADDIDPNVDAEPVSELSEKLEDIAGLVSDDQSEGNDS